MYLLGRSSVRPSSILYTEQNVLFLKNTAIVIYDVFSIGPEAQPGGSQRREAFSVTCSDSIII